MKPRRQMGGGFVSKPDIEKLWREATPEFRAWALKVFNAGTQSSQSIASPPQSHESVASATLSKFPPAVSLDQGRDPRG